MGTAVFIVFFLFFFLFFAILLVQLSGVLYFFFSSTKAV